jgi:uncharacterized protein YbjT (DUF2867 family)
VIDLANSPSFEDKAVLEFFETSERNLLPADASAGVGHHVALSIVAIDRTDNGYFRAKVAQEKLIEASGVPYTILRSTQFLEFLRGIADSSTDRNIVRIPPVLFQPIAADDVAAAVAEAVLAAPRNDLRACQSLFEPLAGDSVDAASGRACDDLMAALAQDGDSLRPDQARAADDDDLHGLPPSLTKKLTPWNVNAALAYLFRPPRWREVAVWPANTKSG